MSEHDLFLPTASADSSLYRQFFTDKELAALDAFPEFSAASEISLIRVLIVRLLHAAEQIKLTLKHRLQMFTAFCHAALTMASLARFEFSQQRPPPSLRDLIYQMDSVDAILAPKGLSRRIHSNQVPHFHAAQMGDAAQRSMRRRGPKTAHL